MDAFAAMDDDLFGPTMTVSKPRHQEQQQQQHKQQQQQQQQPQEQQEQRHYLRKLDSSPSIELVEASAFSDAHHQLLTRYTGIQADAEEDVMLTEQQKQQQQQMDSSPRCNNNNSNNVSADPTDSKETCKDAGSWSSQATSVLLDVFREKRIAVNGRNFRGEEWDELAIGVNEKCHQHLMANGSSGSSFSSPSAAAAVAAAKDQWKTAKQCSYKMSNLKRKYKSEKEMLQLSGPNSVSAWQWFSKMDDIFSSDPKYAVLGSVTQLARIDHATASVVAAAAADFFDEELMLNNMNKNNSKSTSATNNSPSPSRQQQNETANSPRCISELHVRKKQCLSNNNNNIYANSSSPGSSDFVMPASFADSMKLMLVQQKETIQLLRELVSIKQHNRGQEAPDNSELLESTRGLLDLRLKIESVDRELMQLKLIYEAKEREFKDALLAYEEKCRVKEDLVRKLTEAAFCKERGRNRVPETNSESI